MAIGMIRQILNCTSDLGSTCRRTCTQQYGTNYKYNKRFGKTIMHPVSEKSLFVKPQQILKKIFTLERL